MAALDTLLQLRVHVHRHLRVGVTDLAHHPLHVEVVGEQGDGDVGAPEAVRRDVRERRQAARRDLFVGERRSLPDDLADPLAVDPTAARVRDQVVLGAGGRTDPAQPVQVLDHRLDQVGRHLHLADARLGFGVGDAEARALGVVQSELADLEIAQLADADARAAKDLADHAATDVAAPNVGVDLAHVEADRGLGHAELARDLVWPISVGEHPGDHRRGDAELRRNLRFAQRVVLLGRRVEHGRQLVHLQEGPAGLRDTDAHPLGARRVRLDVSVLDGVVKDRSEPADQLAHRCRAERHQSSPSVVAEIRARRDGLAQLAGLGELVRLEGEAHVTVDLVQRVAPEVRQQVTAQPPAVVRSRVLGDRLVAVDAVDLGLQPHLGVRRERRNAGRLVRIGEGWRRLGPLPHANADQGEDVAQLGTGAWLVPPSPATAATAGLLMQGHCLARAVGAEAKLKGSRSIGERSSADGAGRGTRHSDHPPSCVSTVLVGHRDSPPGVLAGGRCTVPRPLSRCGDSTRGGGRCWRVRDAIQQRLPVEAEPPARPAEPDTAELVGVLVDPIALDAQEACNLSSVNETRCNAELLVRPHQLGYPQGDLLNVVGVELH